MWICSVAPKNCVTVLFFFGIKVVDIVYNLNQFSCHHQNHGGFSYFYFACKTFSDIRKILNHGQDFTFVWLGSVFYSFLFYFRLWIEMIENKQCNGDQKEYDGKPNCSITKSIWEFSWCSNYKKIFKNWHIWFRYESYYCIIYYYDSCENKTKYTSSLPCVGDTIKICIVHRPFFVNFW